MRPAITLRNRQRAIAFDVPFIRRMALAARPACLAATCLDEAPLSRLEEIEVTILADRAIGRVHDEFFGDPSPTDVITFPHGEILLGAGVIEGNALRYGQSASDEAALCVIHGLLHLAGWSDLTPRERKDMAWQQERIFKAVRSTAG